MKKGITPIIAILMLLFITIALAGTAWTFMNQYFTQTVGKNLQISDSFCQGGTTAKVILRNVGTESINIGTCATSMSGTEVSCGDVTVIRRDGGNLNSATFVPQGGGNVVQPQGLVTLTDLNCTSSGVSNTCIYRFVVGSVGAVQSTVTCSG